MRCVREQERHDGGWRDTENHPLQGRDARRDSARGRGIAVHTAVPTPATERAARPWSARIEALFLDINKLLSGGYGMINIFRHYRT